MIYANVDEQSRIKLLEAMKETQDKKWYRRLKIIDLSGWGHPVPTLANMFNQGQQTIRTYIHRYNQNGIDGLKPDYGRGRDLALDWTKDQWLALLGQAPSQFEALDSGAQNWTQALMTHREGVYSIHEHKRHQELIYHLQLLMNRYPDYFLFVVADNASAHRTSKVTSFCQEHGHQLELVFLPTYSPHLNLIERLWRVMR